MPDNAPNSFIVTATTLRLRSAPAIAPSNILASLALGQPVSRLEPTTTDWWKVRATLAGQPLDGYVAARYLAAGAPAVQAPLPVGIPAVHYPPSPQASRASTDHRHCPLGEIGLPRRDGNAASAQRVADVHRIVDFLDVERSARYQPTVRSTFCNIYAYDVCCLADVYLPRVWWTAKALLKLSKGESVPVVYDDTVGELNANALYDWLDQWGDDFGWQRSFDLTALQTQINDGHLGVICARRKDLSRSGHITVVLPEREGVTADRLGATVTAPLQSQAGARNKKYFAASWWIARSQDFSRVGFWWHA